MEVEINYIAVGLAIIASLLVGTIWYAKPVFGSWWMRTIRLDDKKAQKGAFRAIVLTIIVSSITAFVLAHAAYIAHIFFGNSFLQDSVMTAFWLWLGFTAARISTHDAFEQRPWRLTALNISYELITILIMGVIIGFLPPSSL